MRCVQFRVNAGICAGSELVAGACYKAIQDAMGERLVKSWSLPRNGRLRYVPVDEYLCEVNHVVYDLLSFLVGD